MKKVIGYTRIPPGGDEALLQKQASDIELFCKNWDFKLLRIESDIAEGVGKTGGRPEGMRAVLESIARNEVMHLVIADLVCISDSFEGALDFRDRNFGYGPRGIWVVNSHGNLPWAFQGKEGFADV